jgi:hypothetical protein
MGLDASSERAPRWGMRFVFGGCKSVNSSDERALHAASTSEVGTAH